MAIPHRGSWFGLPDFGVTERLAQAMGKGTTSQGGSNIIKNTGTAYSPAAPSPGGGQSGVYKVSSPGGTGSSPASVQGVNTSVYSGGGGGGGGGGQVAIPQTQDPNFDQMRGNAEDQGRRALEAAMGVYNAKKQATLNRIPGLEDELNLTLQGYDQNLENFNQTADREQGKRVGDLQLEGQQIGEQYTQAARKTRASAKGLARQLRNQFAGRGTLDSTQYRDMNIEQSTGIAQGLGDLNREQAGKVTANTREQEDIKGYYSEQKLQEQKRIGLAKEQAQSQTRSLKQQIIDDANLTDAQKIEAVVEAEGRLQSRLEQLDSQQLEFQNTRAKEQADLQSKMATLGSKGYSDSYKTAKNSSEALSGAAATIQQFTDRYGAITPQAASKIFQQFGFDEEEASYYGTMYGGKKSAKKKDSGTSSSGVSW